MSRYFIYTRKSTESEDRQALSLHSQKDELTRFIKNLDFEPIFLSGESKSAKKPGRPIFNEMMARIELGEAEGIVAWHPDRLARNAIDGGQILHLLDRGILKDLKFPNYAFENNAQGKFMLGIFLTQSKYYSDSLSENVKRGLRTKIRMGWLPSQPPPGYLNDPVTRGIVPDPERFEIVKCLWDSFLTGKYSLDGLVDLGLSLGLTGKLSKGKGTKGLNRTTIYDMLNNPFYAGRFMWKGELHEGAHEPMINQDGFDRAQKILRSRGKPRPKLLKLPYRGLIECGACAHKVTAERKTHPRSGRRYLYYRCAIQRRGCSEPSLEIAQLEAQMEERLADLRIPTEIYEHLIEHLVFAEKHDDQQVEAQLAMLKKQLSEKENGLGRLLDLRLREVLGDEEYLSEKKKLLEAKARLVTRIESREESGKSGWAEEVRSGLTFNQEAIESFRSGSYEEREAIMAAVCSNQVLQDKKLRILAKFPHCLVWNLPSLDKTCTKPFEPVILGQDKTKNTPFEGACPEWSALLNNVRNTFTALGDAETVNFQC